MLRLLDSRSAKYDNSSDPDRPGLVWRKDRNECDTRTDIPTTIGDEIEDPGIIISETTPVRVPTTSASCTLPMVDNESINDPFAIPGHVCAGIISTTSAFRTETYEEQSGRKAGACVPRNEVTEDSYKERREDTHEEGREDTHDETNPYYPFNNLANYALALWFQDTGCTKGDVNNFFKNELLEPFHIGLKRPPPFHLGLSFKNGEEWLSQLDQIPTGVCNNDWRELELTVETEMEEQVPSIVIVQYGNVINAIKFLLGHFPFALDLVYSPIRQYNDDNKRVYTEMHTGDWWWNTQQKLPDGSTIVPLLIGTDKTVLTQHYGNVATWSVYLTIGNLKAKVQ
ncbi:hypothetical protein MMC07_009035 [Pseudocyphellaria aurata]|nr:hypothetical protein [Pseudocyphellaria aurata]